jgi:hypothetical protein
MDYIQDSFGLIRGLQLAKFTLRLRVIEKIILPEYKGSTFRGCLGWQLKKVICVNSDADDCPDCFLSPKCLYNYLFSPPLPPNTQFLHHTSRIPAPIILEPPLTTQCTFEPGDVMEAGLVLIGKGLDYLPYMIFVFTEIGKSGIGTGLYSLGGKRRGGRFELESVCDMDGHEIYSSEGHVLRDSYRIYGWEDAVSEFDQCPPQNMTFEFLTPTRIKKDKDTNDLLSHLSDFGQIITNLYWRLLLLSYFHCNPWGLDDERFSGLADEATDMRQKLSEANHAQLVDNHTHWKHNARWSNRHQTKMPFGGFTGRASFTGDFTPYLPLLALGQYTHLGKQTLFGMGMYRFCD